MLGAQPRIENGGVTWEGDARTLMRANLWLRTASRVLVRVAQFKAKAFFELEKHAKKIPWSEFVPVGSAVDFRVTARKSKLYHSDAIAERLIKAANRPVGEEGQLFVVRVFHDDVTISADSSGELLHIRGYRQAVAKAPLRETLAAALLLGSGWAGDMPLVDPFCGSGTLPIEGALIARRIAPGLHRRFAFMNWPTFDASEWRDLLDEAHAAVLASSPVSILGSDRDAGAIEAARTNAERAGVAADVEFSKRVVSAVQPPAVPGLMATNPPYGKRVSEKADIRNLYAQLGNMLRDRGRGWRVALYSPGSRLTKQIGLPLRELFRTSNGGIKVAAMLGEVPE